MQYTFLVIFLVSLFIASLNSESLMTQDFESTKSPGDDNLIDGTGSGTGTSCKNDPNDDTGFCTQKTDSDDDENELQKHNPIDSKYSKSSNNPEWLKYHELITEAELKYNATITNTNLPKCDKSSCSCYLNQMQDDLEVFKTSGITKVQIESAKKRGTLYQIINNKLYREPDCKFPARCSGIEHFLLEILDELPPVSLEFIINVSDYPQVHRRIWELEGERAKLPVFSFSKTKEYFDILYPAWSFWDGGPSISIFPTGLGRWDLLRKSIIKASKETSWNTKLSQGFFRGSRTSAERDSLILLSRAEPELLDAKYTKNQAWRSEADTLGQPVAPEVALEFHCKYKYLFNYRGVAASFRFKHLFLCRSTVFHVGNGNGNDDEWIEFFYPQLKPWIHYVPVPKDSSQLKLKSLLQFAMEHDIVMKKIANRGYAFIKNNLRLGHINCYWKHLLENYTKLIKYDVTLRPDFVQIKKR